MKKLMFCLVFAAFCSLFFSFLPKEANKNELKGTWKLGNLIMIFTDSYYSITDFDAQKKVFTSTMGGTYAITERKIDMTIEFSFPDSQLVGRTKETIFDLQKNGQLLIKNKDKMEVWTRLADSGEGNLAGLWQIIGREQKEGTMGEMKKGARKTVKIMTQNRFQWVAMNTETKVFSGTGGGSYTLKDGKYTETIEFFSRDSSRIGFSLSFDAKVEGKKWQHTGKSSKGDRVNEIWENQE